MLFKNIVRLRYWVHEGYELSAGYWGCAQCPRPESRSISIDYKHRKITRGLSGLARHSVDVKTFTASGAPYWVVPILLGGVEIRVLLDTGANDLGLFAPRGLKPFKFVRSETIAHDSAAGEQKAFAMPPMILVLNDGEVKAQVAVIVGEAPSELREIDGVLGPTVLGITRTGSRSACGGTRSDRYQFAN